MYTENSTPIKELPHTHSGHSQLLVLPLVNWALREAEKIRLTNGLTSSGSDDFGLLITSDGLKPEYNSITFKPEDLNPGQTNIKRLERSEQVLGINGFKETYDFAKDPVSFVRERMLDPKNVKERVFEKNYLGLLAASLIAYIDTIALTFFFPIKDSTNVSPEEALKVYKEFEKTTKFYHSLTEFNINVVGVNDEFYKPERPTVITTIEEVTGLFYYFWYKNDLQDEKAIDELIETVYTLGYRIIHPNYYVNGGAFQTNNELNSRGEYFIDRAIKKGVAIDYSHSHSQTQEEITTRIGSQPKLFNNAMVLGSHGAEISDMYQARIALGNSPQVAKTFALARGFSNASMRFIDSQEGVIGKTASYGFFSGEESFVKSFVKDQKHVGEDRQINTSDFAGTVNGRIIQDYALTNGLPSLYTNSFAMRDMFARYNIPTNNIDKFLRSNFRNYVIKNFV